MADFYTKSQEITFNPLKASLKRARRGIKLFSAALLLLLMLGMPFTGRSQDFGEFASALLLSVNGGPNTFYNTSGSGANLIGSQSFTGSLGTFNTAGSIVLKGAEVKTWKNNGGNSCIPRLMYRVYKVGDTPPAYQFSQLNESPYPSECNTSLGTFFIGGGPCGNGDLKWQRSDLSIDISAFSAGDYVFEAYFEYDGGYSGSDCSVTKTIGSSSTPFSMNFILSATCANDLTVSPTSVSPVCQNGTAPTLTATLGTSSGVSAGNITYQWYENSTNSTSGGTAYGSPITTTTATTTTTLTPPVSSPGTKYYYAVVTNTDPTCSGSFTTAAVEVTVNPLPTLTAVAQDATVCSGTNAQINLSGLLPNTTTDVTYNIGGSGTTTVSVAADGSGNGTISIPVTSANNGQNFTVTGLALATGCGVSGLSVSGTLDVLTPPTSTISPINTTICANANYTLSANQPASPAVGSWSVVSGPNTGAGQFSDVNAYNAVFTPAGGAGTYRLRWTVSNPPCAAASSEVDLLVNAVVVPSVTLAPNPAAFCEGSTAGITATPTNGGASPVYAWTIDGNAFGGNTASISPALSAGSYTIAVTVTSNAACATPATASVSLPVTINPLPGAPAAGNNSRCGSGAISITATPGANETIDWYTTASGGAPVLSGNTTYAIGNLATTTTYYALARNTITGCISATRTAVTATINPVPAKPTSAQNNISICGAGTANLTASVGPGAQIDWYTTAVGGTPVLSNSTSYSPSVPLGVTKFYAEASTAAGCVSAERLEFTVTANAIPADPVGTAGSRCSTGTVTLTATGAATLRWYNMATGGTVLGSGTSFTTPSISTTTTFYVESFNAATNCLSARVPVVATVNPLPAVPTGATGNAVCVSGSMNISATPPSGSTLDWYAAPTGGSVLAGGTTTFTTPIISATTTYYAESRDNTTGCVSPTRLAVVATVNAKPDAPGGSAAGTACGANGNTLLTGTGAGANEVYEWFTVATGGTAFATGASVTSPQLNGNTTVYVQKRNTITDCISDRTPVSIVWAANVTPSVTIASSASQVCTSVNGESTGAVFTATPTNGGTPSYQWLSNGNPIGGATNATYTLNSSASAVNISVRMTSTATCASPNPVTSASIPITTVSAEPSSPSNNTISGPSSICPPSNVVFTLSNPPVNGTTSYVWSVPTGWNITSGAGTTSISVAVTSAAADGNFSISVAAKNACGTSNFGGSPTGSNKVEKFVGVDAGADVSICSGTSIALSAPPQGAATQVAWTVSPTGSGSFSAVNTSNGTATFTPTGAGPYTLTATTNTANGACQGNNNSASDAMVLTIRQPATATWAQPITICEGTSGTLTINNPRTIAETVTYKIGTGTNQTIAVPANGSATINTGTLTTNTTVTIVSAAYSSGPACLATINSDVTVTVSPKVIVNAGAPQTVCSNGTITLAGSITGGTNAGTWSAPTGSFDNAALVNAVYTPGKTSGTETLTLTSADPDGAGPCTAESSTVVITINEAPAISIGSLTTPICQGSSFALSATRSGSATANTWSTNATGGTFSAPNGTTTNYTPASTFTGALQFTVVTNDPDGTGPCVADTKTINAYVNPAATIDAGPDFTLCEGGVITLAGVAGGGATNVQWTATSGTFSDASNPTSNYTPSVTSGTITLTLTALDPDGAGPCPAVQDQMVVTVEAAPAITAIGGPDEVCASAAPSPIQLSGVTTTGGATGGTWSFLPAGAGTLSNVSFTTNPSGVSFTPAAGFSGDVTLRLTTNSTANCAESYAERTISVKPAPTVDAGANQTVCSDATINLTATVDGVVATGGVWTTSGSGTLGTPSALSTTYVPSANDITSGTVTFTFTTNEPADACTAVNDQVVVTIKKAPAITSQPQSEVVCASFPKALSVTATGDALTYQWYKGNPGTGVAVTGGTSATLNFTQAQVADAGNYYVIVTGGSPCGSVTSNVATLVVNEQINITQQPAAVTVCEGDAPFKLTTTATAGPDALSYQWYKGTPGSGTIVNDGGNISGATTNELNFANFLPADGGSYYAVISGPPGFVCATATTNAAVITIKEKPIVTANPTSQTLCSGDQTAIALTSSVANTTFAWTVNQTNGAAGAADGSGPIIAQTLTTGSAVGTATYTITPTANGCVGNPIDVAVTINPRPTLTYNPNTDFEVCSGSNANIELSSTLSGTTFSWTASASGVTGAAAGSGTGTLVVINDVLSASGTSNGTVTYTITNATAPGGCTTATKSIVVTVKPIPTTTITNNKANFCSHASTDIALSSPVSGTTFAWSAAVTSGMATFTGATTGNGNQITQAIQNTGTTDAIITYTITPTANGCIGSPTTTTVTVKPLPSGSIAAQIVGGGQTVCLNGTAPLQLTGSNGTPNYEFFYTVNGANSASVSTTGGSSTISVNAPTNVAGTFTYQLYAIKDANSTEAACPQAIDPPKDAVITVKPLPTASIAVTNPTVCIGTSSPVITLTGATGIAPYTFTYNINGGANQTVSSSGNTATINAPTGTAGTFTYNLVSVAENGATPACTQPQTGSAVVTITPDATINLTSGSSTPAVCIGNGLPSSIVYTVDGSATGATVTGLPAGVTSSYNATTKQLTISGTPTTSGTFNYSVTTTGPCVTPSLGGTITVSTPPNGGTAAPANNLFICEGDPTTVNLTGQDGNVNKWQMSTNGGLTWTDIASTATSLPTGNLNATTWFRAVVSKPGCNAPGQIVNSVHAVVSVVPKTGPGAITVTGAPAFICSGSVTLTANGFGQDSSVGNISGGNFDNAGVELDGPGKWRKTLIANWDSQDKPNIEASTNNTINSAFNLTNGPKDFLTSTPCTTTTYNNNPLGGQTNNTKFMMVVGPNTSSLESPIFNLVGLTSASMDWWEAFILEAGASIKIEISTDGGATYNTTLQTITGPTTKGSPTDFTLTSLNLNDYLGLSNLRIKFTYTGTQCSSWGLEQATITKGVAPANYTWNLTQPTPAEGTPPGHYLNVFVNQSVQVTPPANTSDTPQVYKYSIASSAGGCLSDITVTVNPTPSVSAAVAPAATCGSSTFDFNVGGPVAGTIFSWTRTNTTNLTGVPASGTGNISGTLTNTTNSVQSSTFTITPTYSNGGVSCPGTPITRTITVNPNPTATMDGSFNCNASQATVNITIPTVGPYSGVLVTQGGDVPFSGTNAGPGSAVVTLTPNQTVNSTFTYSLQSLSVNGCPVATLPTLTLAAAPQAGVTGTWTCGAGDGDWFNPCNWANGIVPTLDIDVIIPAGTCNAVIDPLASPFTGYSTATAYARNITINGQGIEMPETTSQLHVAGNWTNNVGTSGFSAGQGTVSFVGNSTNTPNCDPQTINTVGASETFNNLVINNTCDRDGTGDNVVLNKPVNVGGVLTLTDGIVKTTDANILNVTNCALGAVVGGADNTYVNGPMTRATCSTGQYNFPVGHPNGPYGPYRPAIVQPQDGSNNTYRAEYKLNTIPNTGLAGNALGVIVTEHWDIKPTNCSQAASIGLPYVNPNNNSHWGPSGLGVPPCPSCNVAVVQAPPANGFWDFTGTGNFSSSRPEYRFWTDAFGLIWGKYVNNICANNIWSFGFSLNTILPIKLVTFDGKQEGPYSKLTWAVADNNEVNFFDLQHSTDGINFKDIGRIRQGNSAFYEFLHRNPVRGANYYRLFMKSKDGSEALSRVVVVMHELPVTVITGLKYTLSRGNLQVGVISALNQKMEVSVVDAVGRVMWTEKVSIATGDNTVPLSTSFLAQGIYFVVAQTEDGVRKSMKFMRE